MAMTLPIQSGQLVSVSGQLCEITRALGFDAVLVKNIETGETHKVQIGDLALPLDAVQNNTSDNKTAHPDLSLIPEERWEIARQRYKTIKPLLDKTGRTVAAVDAQAESADVDRATVYRWLDKFERSGLLSSLIPLDRKGPRDKRLSDDVEAIIKAAIEEEYKTLRKKSIMKVYNVVKGNCRKAGIPTPHYNTVNSRIKALPKKERVASRVSKRKAAQEFDPTLGAYPDANFPYAVFQIDHTGLPVNVVDEVSRKPIGKPWLTLAIDVNSRMVAGLYLSLDPPSAMSVGLCLVHAILPKEKYLAGLGISESWPVWGIMDAVHADNAKEFRGNMLKRATEEHHFDLYWRPVKTPHYGGHIERLLGTFKEDMRGIPGAVGKDKEGRDEYHPEQEAALTLRELEKWLAVYVTQVYHQKYHSGIGMSPIKKYEEGIFGVGVIPGCGIPDRIVDEDRLRIDFLPFVERTVQNYGVVLNHVYYYGPVLKRWINAADPAKPRAKRLFLFRYDPRDMSVLYFYDPEIEDYFEVPYRDTARPPLSLWELRQAQRWLEKKGVKSINEDLIFDAHDSMREIEENAVRETKKVRREEQRRREAKRATKPKTTAGTISILPVTSPPKDIVPYDEMEEL